MGIGAHIRPQNNDAEASPLTVMPFSRLEQMRHAGPRRIASVAPAKPSNHRL